MSFQNRSHSQHEPPLYNNINKYNTYIFAIAVFSFVCPSLYWWCSAVITYVNLINLIFFTNIYDWSVHTCALLLLLFCSLGRCNVNGWTNTTFCSYPEKGLFWRYKYSTRQQWYLKNIKCVIFIGVKRGRCGCHATGDALQLPPCMQLINHILAPAIIVQLWLALLPHRGSKFVPLLLCVWSIFLPHSKKMHIRFLENSSNKMAANLKGVLHTSNWNWVCSVNSCLSLSVGDLVTGSGLADSPR